MLITSEELRDASILPDNILAYTRRLFTSKIFNHKNYILIMLTSTVKGWFQEIRTSIKFIRRSSDRNLTNIDTKTPVDQYLNATFQFFWRFFKGQKIAICCEDTCHWYDPFEKRVFSYPTESKRNLFSVRNRNSSVLKYYVNDDADTLTEQAYEIFKWSLWLDLVIDSMNTQTFRFPGNWYPLLREALKYDTFRDPLLRDVLLAYDAFQKYDINVYAVTPGFSFGAYDESYFDHNIAN
ncbi:unnamed protein product [Bemisia tabaci]|uniref:Uncharacterized protein n=1 Tax=Bemisia tabaci TaxID=7038 RepID=A0A9P0A302_BEMTA|nr:unnamed protein product [Bemisia tabaci]